jgi:hypothetical protein
VNNHHESKMICQKEFNKQYIEEINILRTFLINFNLFYTFYQTELIATCHI